MIGTSWRRKQWLDDPLLAGMVRDLGLEEVPQFAAHTETILRNKGRIRDLAPLRDGPVNPNRAEMPDPVKNAAYIKDKATALGADLVGIARLQPVMIDLRVDLPHEYVIAIGVSEDYELVVQGPRAVEEKTYEVYRNCAEISTRLARHLREDLGWTARAHHNGATEIQAIPVLYHAGFGELGKHGSLINPEHGASFRPGFVTTDLPMAVDAPLTFGVQDRCLNCQVCRNNCPGDAIPDDYIVTQGIKRWITDMKGCYPYSRLRAEYCHLCVDVCPYNAPIHRDTYKAFMRDRKDKGYKNPRRESGLVEV